MANGAQAASDDFAKLLDALEARSKAAGFSLGPNAANLLAQQALNRINARGGSEDERQKNVEKAIDALDEVAASVVATTQQRSFADANSIRSLMRAKSCDCPWPWGDER